MILQSLYQYYGRLANTPGSGISPPGYSQTKVSFALVIRPDGELVNLIDLRRQEKGKARSAEIQTPQRLNRSSDITANFLWGKTSYVLGIGKDEKDRKKKRVADEFAEFRHRQEDIIGQSQDEGLLAVLRFVGSWNPATASTHPVVGPRIKDVREAGNLIFRLDGDQGYVHDRPTAREVWDRYPHQSEPKGKKNDSNKVIGQCLITGECGPIARIHEKLKGMGDKPAGLVSFDDESFRSYGKEKCYNAPVSQSAAFAYTEALNHLLSSQNQRQQVGDAKVVFWAERDTPVENLLTAVFGGLEFSGDEAPKEPQAVVTDQGTEVLIRDLLRQARDGVWSQDGERAIHGLDLTIRFYILGLSPNQGRVSVRFWLVTTLGELSKRLGLHYADLCIEHRDNEPEFVSIPRILRQLVPKETAKREDWFKHIPHNIEAGLIRAALLGESYPTSLLPMLLGRIRADHEVNYVRAATLKACLLRHARQQNKTLLEAAMTLNEDSVNCGYRLGRLFAVLEKAQQDAIGETNATIRDRFGAVSVTPGLVFPQLLKLAQHHLSKLASGTEQDRSRSRWLDKLIREALEPVKEFPAYQDNEDQGLFWLGYYHQKNDLYRKHDKGSDKDQSGNQNPEGNNA